MKLRGYLGVSIMMAFIAWLPFLVVYALMMTYLEEYTIRQAFVNSLFPSIMFAVMYGFAMGYFYRIDTIKFKMVNVDTTRYKLIIEMAKLGYHPDNQVGNVITFTPNIYGGRAAGNISAIYQDDELTLTGPRYHIRNISKKLR